MQKNIAFFQKNHSYVVTISQHRVINDISGDMGETLEKVSPISPAKAIKTRCLFKTNRTSRQYKSTLYVVAAHIEAISKKGLTRLRIKP